MGLTVSCIQPVTIKTPSPSMITNTAVPTASMALSSPSNIEVSPSPIVFTPAKGRGAITGLINFSPETGNNHKNMIHINVYDAINQKALKFSETSKEQKFIIDDIPILDKQGTDIKLRITTDYYYKFIYTKIYDSRLTDLESITISNKDLNPFYGESSGVLFIVQDENENILKDGLITDITGGYISPSRNINKDGEFYINTYFHDIILPDTFSKIEIKSNNKIMTLIHNDIDTKNEKITFVPNARTVFGYIFDINNKSKPLEGLKVIVLNQDIAVRTDEYGRYELRGLPFDEVTVEIDDTVKIIVPKVYDSEQRLLNDIYYSGS
jgi:hypothetical protein